MEGTTALFSRLRGNSPGTRLCISNDSPSARSHLVGLRDGAFDGGFCHDPLPFGRQGSRRVLTR
jgi:hypothetical protein